MELRLLPGIQCHCLLLTQRSNSSNFFRLHVYKLLPLPVDAGLFMACAQNSKAKCCARVDIALLRTLTSTVGPIVLVLFDYVVLSKNYDLAVVVCIRLNEPTVSFCQVLTRHFDHASKLLSSISSFCQSISNIVR